MRSLWFFRKGLVLIPVLLLASSFWHTEVQAQSASLHLTWTDTSNNEDGFKIERLVAGLVDATLSVPASATSYADSALNSGTVYCYRVQAFNSAGNSDPSNQACAMAQSDSTASVSASPTTVRPGATTTASWSGIVAPSATDWIGLYAPGSADTNFINWIYVSCSTTPSGSRASGSCSYPLPAAVSLGNYELRLFANDGYTRLAASNSVTVTNTTLTASPTTVKAGSTVNATWTEIGAPMSLDWIGLYAPGAVDTAYINWIYVSCSKIAATARASGSCSYPLPTTLAAGTYELRLFANDDYTRLATSNRLTVSTSTNSTNSIVLANVTTTSNTSTSGLLVQAPKGWTDYDFKVNLRSMNNQSIGVMFRYQDDRNYYRLVWNQKSKFRRLEKIENGVATVLAKDAVGYVKGRTYQLQVIVQGASLSIFIDGAQIFSVADSTFSEGTVGLYASSNQASFDTVVVRDLVTGTVLLSDDFNSGNFSGWTIVDQGKTLGPSLWSVMKGALVQTSNIDGTFALYTLRPWTDYRFAAKLRSMDNGAIGVMFRYEDNRNYYRFVWDAQNKSRRLEKVQNGLVTALASHRTPYLIGQTYNLEITARGALLEVRIDGSAVFSATDSSFDRGTIALYSRYNQGSSFDNVLVQDLATGAVLLSDDFDDDNFTGWTVVDKGTEGGPSSWSASSGSLVQSSNIGSANSFDGTLALY